MKKRFSVLILSCTIIAMLFSCLSFGALAVSEGNEIVAQFQGYGDDVIDEVTVGDGVYVAHLTHSGTSNFIVKEYDGEGKRHGIVNEIGYYDGIVILENDGPYMFNIQADGNWTVSIEKLGTSDDLSFSGKGDFVTPIISIGKTNCTVTLTHNGTSNFIVKAYSGGRRNGFVNEIGSYNGKQIVQLKGDTVYFSIHADGNWTLDIK